MKKWILFLSLLQGLLIFHAQAEVIASGDNCGDDCHWEYDNTTKTLSFTGTGAMYNYTTDPDIHDKEGREWASNRPWINYISEVKNIEIGEGITNTGNYLCAHCKVLEAISLPNSIQGVDLDSFWDTNLKDIALPSSIQYVDHEAFLNSKNIQNIYCPKTKKTYCENALAESNSHGNLTIYTKDEYGVFSVTKDGITYYYSSADNMMAGGVEKGCTSQQSCAQIANTVAISQADGSTKFVTPNGRVRYQGKRIYTVDEANMVAGKKNTFKIRYK